MKFKNYIEAQSGIKDSADSPGTLDQVLTSTATGVAWVDPSTISAEAATLVVIECKNTSGATITKGTPVYQTGTVGATDVIEIAPADALISAGSQPAIGLLQTTLNDNGFGKVVITGELLNFTTDPIDGLTPTTGDKIFLKSGGGLTLTKPTGAENGIQNLGLIGKVSGGNAGSITVSSIMRTNDVPNLPTGKIWVGDGNTIVSDTVFLDEPNGRMGIGTTSPSYKLSVNGDIQSDFLRSYQYPTASFLDFDDDTVPGSNGIALVSVASMKFNIDSNNNATTDVFSWIANGAPGSGSTLMTLTDEGLLGIGTTSPSGLLHVSSGTSGDAIVIIESDTDNNNENDNPQLQFKQDGGSTIAKAGLTGDQGQIFGNSLGNAAYFGNDENASVQFYTNATAALTIRENGNVGIGTTSPGRKLSVNGSIELTGSDMTLNTTSAAIRRGTAGQMFLDAPGDVTVTIDSNSNNTDRVFNVRKDTGSELFRIQENGNVGIGTTSPTANLHIQGSSATDVPIIRSGGFGNSGSKLELAETLTAGGDMNYGFSFFNDGNGSNTLQIRSHNNSTAGVMAMNIGRTNALTTFGTVPIVGTRTAGDNTTYAASTAFVTSAVAGVPIGDYLPLAAGSGSPLTGDLYITKNSPVLTITDTVASDLKLEIKQSGSTSNFMSRGGTSSKGQFNFRITDGSTVTNALFINQQANVGIGTTSPSATLEINSDTSNAAKLKIGRQNTATNYLELGTSGGESVINAIGIAGVNAALIFNRSTTTTTSESMRITSSGNVGIGTTSPGARLDVIGRAEIDAYASQVTGTASDSGYLRLIGGSKTGWGVDDELGKIEFYGEDASGVGARNAASIRAVCETGNGTSTTTFSSGLAFYTSPYNAAEGERLRIDKDGNVGIGTTSPTRKLDVAGTSLFQDSVYVNTSTGSEGLYVTRLGSASESVKIYTTDSTSVFETFQDENVGEYGSMAFILDDGAPDPSYVFRYGSNVRLKIEGGTGNVGIGTTSPGVKLDVNGDIRGFNSVRVDGDITGSPFFGLYQNGTEKAYIQYVDSGDNLVLQSDGIFTFKTATAERMRITSGGNVGIGTTAPQASAKLDVRSDSEDAGAHGIKAYGYNETSTAILGQGYATGTGAGTNYGVRGVSTGPRSGVAGSVNVGGYFEAVGAETNYALITGSGNVGIGTTSPAAKLEVYGSAPFIYITDDTETESGIIFRDIQAGLSQAAAIKFSSSDNKLRFYNNDTAAERMTIDTLGNVGIGVTGPSARIHALYSGLAAKFVSSQGTGLEVQGGGNSQPIARFKNTAASEKVTISSTGNLGIGVTAPSQLLHVAGNMRLQNQLYDATNSAGTNGQVLTKVSQGTSWQDPAVNAQMPNNTDPASASNVGTIRYRSTSNTSFVDVSMQTGATTYTWVNIVSNFW